MLLKRLPSTILLMGCSLVVSLALSIPLGLIAGYKKNTRWTMSSAVLPYFGMSIPSFYFGMLMIILFTATLHILPSSGMHTVGVNTPLDTIQHMLMPVMTMALGTMASKTRYVRANTIGQLSEEYVLAAKAKGTSPRQILRKHVLKNTLLPIITILGMNMASLVCGSFIIESVFGWPGVGSFAMEAIGKKITQSSWRMLCCPASFWLWATLSPMFCIPCRPKNQKRGSMQPMENKIVFDERSFQRIEKKEKDLGTVYHRSLWKDIVSEIKSNPVAILRSSF